MEASAIDDESDRQSDYVPIHHIPRSAWRRREPDTNLRYLPNHADTGLTTFSMTHNPASLESNVDVAGNASFSEGYPVDSTSYSLNALKYKQESSEYPTDHHNDRHMILMTR